MLQVRALATRIGHWIGRLMPDGDPVHGMIADLADRFGARTEEVTAAACAEVEAAARGYSRHVILEYQPNGTEPEDAEPRGWPEPDLADLADLGRRAGGISAVRRLPDGTCLIEVTGLEPPAVALPYVYAAFALASQATQVVVDLRANAGGETATLAAIAGCLLGDTAVHLADARFVDRVRQWWTPDLPAGTALPARTPVSVLTSGRTFSNGEALAYHLQARGRARVVGETTRGAAHYVTPIQLAPVVLGLLPEAVTTDIVTGTNWEGQGVIPDLACPADAALATATGLDLAAP